MKKLVVVTIVVALALTVILTGCSIPNQISDKDYIASLEASGVFANKYADALPQTVMAGEVKKHVASGPNKKALYIAYDGARADLLVNIVKNKDESLGKISEDSACSGINEIKKTGGLYVAYTGGDVRNEATRQEASTVSGFSTILSGQWANEHKAYTNADGAKRVGDTILMQLADLGRKVSFNACWDVHFDTVFKSEFDKKPSNYIANKAKSDLETYNNMLGRVTAGDDLVFGILENVDNNGHAVTFHNTSEEYVKAFMDSDMYAYKLVQEAYAREKAYGEDWLIIITSDHGGHYYGHGTKELTDTSIFIACNKIIFEV